MLCQWLPTIPENEISGHVEIVRLVGGKFVALVDGTSWPLENGLHRLAYAMVEALIRLKGGRLGPKAPVS